jgi:hypothetical protein
MARAYTTYGIVALFEGWPASNKAKTIVVMNDNTNTHFLSRSEDGGIHVHQTLSLWRQNPFGVRRGFTVVVGFSFV